MNESFEKIRNGLNRAIEHAQGKRIMTQKLHDSGKRRIFKSGAQRDRGDLKPRPDLISPHAMLREGMVFALGAEKYDVRNWEKGMEISECLASAQRHIEQWKLGLTDEDHLAQARWNLGAIIHYEEEIKAGRMDSAIDDMPHYGDREQFRSPTITGGIEIPRKITERDYERSESADTIEWGYRMVHDPQEVTISTFYIAGPMRGYEKYNFPAFDRARDRGIRMGYNIISPADLDREAGIDENSPDITDPAEVREIVQRDLDVITKRLKVENGDGIAVLPDWPISTGAGAEVFVGRWLGLKIIDARDFRRPVNVPAEFLTYHMNCNTVRGDYTLGINDANC